MHTAMISDSNPYLPATETPLHVAVDWEPKVMFLKKTLDWCDSISSALKRNPFFVLKSF